MDLVVKTYGFYYSFSFDTINMLVYNYKLMKFTLNNYTHLKFTVFLFKEMEHKY